MGTRCLPSRRGTAKLTLHIDFSRSGTGKSFLSTCSRMYSRRGKKILIVFSDGEEVSGKQAMSLNGRARGRERGRAEGKKGG